MPYLLLLGAGILIGRKWDAFRNVIIPFAGDASARFDELYSETARRVGTKIEDFEDRVAESRYHARENVIN
ncbi:MAG TPA: hypothetical protein VGL82_07370 [Bryobacteraceae bacterium]|jgi:hypothetical protein